MPADEEGGEDEVGVFGKARHVREGKDLTVVSWSACVHTCEKAAGRLAGDGIETDLFDLRTLWPWDRDAVLASVERTGRLLVAHEAVSVAGFGAEIAATDAENMHTARKAPGKRLAAPRIPISYAPTLEDEVRITEAMIAAAARALVAT
jgi:pyruvate dehydrogenase E1 component beta subunit